MWVERLVDDAPSVVDPEHGQIVAVPHAGVLAPEPDQGGIAFATPDDDKMGNQARPEQTFPLFDKFEDEWLLWAPKIPLGK